MKIIYDSQIFLSQVYGGISRYFFELVRRMDNQEGVHAKIIAPLYINNYIKDLNSGIVSGRHVPHIHRTGFLLKALNQIVAPKRMAKFNPDIVHETYYSNKQPLLSKTVKTIITVYDMIHERYSECFPDNDSTALTKRMNVERADHVICISENTRRDLLEITGIAPSKVSVVHLGFDLTTKSDNFDGIDGTEPYLLYVGDRGGYKNFARLLSSYGKNSVLHKHYKLICFGGGKLKQSEHQLRKALGLAADRLTHIEGNDHILGRLYRHATAFVYPSLYEGFGIPPLEAMSHGCPVICSNGGSIPEIVGNAGQYFDPYEEESMTHAIEQVVSSQECADRLRILGEERITRFSWETCAEKTYKIYKSLKG
ncbi:MAG: glycosyltransferase family 1 protein [Desulfobacterium sp.]|jgi:glycosyltransferase involved in cell wall biosynthesis|nr:glycosyltransferase family 1 protein [Desulfobacterium sp.]